MDSVAGSPERAVEIAMVILGEQEDISDSTTGKLVHGIDCRVYDGKRMFHPLDQATSRIICRIHAGNYQQRRAF